MYLHSAPRLRCPSVEVTTLVRPIALPPPSTYTTYDPDDPNLDSEPPRTPSPPLIYLFNFPNYRSANGYAC